MSVRQTIIDALDAKLRSISTANGYKTNAGSRVYAWRTEELQDNELPALVYQDRLATKSDEGSVNRFRWLLQVDITIAARSAQNTPALIRTIIDDVLKTIGAGAAERWGGVAQSTTLGDSQEMTVERNDVVAGTSTLSIVITYDVPLWEA